MDWPLKTRRIGAQAFPCKQGKQSFLTAMYQHIVYEIHDYSPGLAAPHDHPRYYLNKQHIHSPWPGLSRSFSEASPAPQQTSPCEKSVFQLAWTPDLCCSCLRRTIANICIPRTRRSFLRKAGIAREILIRAFPVKFLVMGGNKIWI